ncbi:MAG: FHA domain-containing protein [Lachnospiraceae bacterium]|nr:FHA domain-containing protein [Lachnospiraceae bacterium]
MQYFFDDDGHCRKITYCIDGQDRFDIFSYEMLRENGPPGLLLPVRAERNGMDAVQYDVSGLDTLKDYLGFRLSMRQLLSVFSQIILAVQAIDEYLLDNSMLVTDIGQIFYDREKSEVKMIYYLLFGDHGQERFEEKLFHLFREIIFSARFAVGDGDRHIAKLLNSINDARDYSLTDFKDVVLKLEKVVSEELSAAENSYGNCQEAAEEPVQYGVTENCRNMYYSDMEAIHNIQEDNTADACREESGIRRFVRKLFAKVGVKEKAEEEENSFIMEEGVVAESACNGVQDGVFDGDTVVLAGGIDPHTPYLIRSSNNERVFIGKRVFRIGKDGRYADYIIADNAAVSRAHAEFMIKDGKMYLTDEDSLNNTYINGSALVSRREYEVNDGDVILFADEEFVLHC